MNLIPQAAALLALAVVALVLLRSRHHHLAAGHLADLDDIKSLNWDQCQRLLATTFSRRGYRVTPPPPKAAPSVDMVLMRKGQRILVHCRHWNVWTVRAKPVRELAEAVSREGAEAGLVLTCGAFADDADAAARDAGIELIDGAGLVELLSEAA